MINLIVSVLILLSACSAKIDYKKQKSTIYLPSVKTSGKSETPDEFEKRKSYSNITTNVITIFEKRFLEKRIFINARKIACTKSYVVVLLKNKLLILNNPNCREIILNNSYQKMLFYNDLIVLLNPGQISIYDVKECAKIDMKNQQIILKAKLAKNKCRKNTLVFSAEGNMLKITDISKKIWTKKVIFSRPAPFACRYGESVYIKDLDNSLFLCTKDGKCHKIKKLPQNCIKLNFKSGFFEDDKIKFKFATKVKNVGNFTLYKRKRKDKIMYFFIHLKPI